MSAEFFLIAPPWEGAPTGGTLYNRYLARAWHDAGGVVRCLDPGAARAALAKGALGFYLCDSLFLSDLPALSASNSKRRPLWALLHYLPTLVQRGQSCDFTELSSVERDALLAADGVVVTSEFMRALLCSWEQVAVPVVRVEPGLVESAESEHGPRERERALETSVSTSTSAATSVTALMVCPLTEGKGVLSVIRALGERARASDSWRLTVIGDHCVEPDYAKTCRAAVHEHPLLARSISLPGSFPHAETLAHMDRAHVFLSASRMESYGMALAEARAAGVIILAVPGGNVAEHVMAHNLLPSVDALAATFLQLTRDREALSRECQMARALGAPVQQPRRMWSTVAAEFRRGVFPDEAHRSPLKL